MILPHIAQLNTKRIVLASASPRRKELLGNLGLKFEIVVSSFSEDLPHHHFEHAEHYAVETARHKAMDVARICAAQKDKPPVDLIISADTIVEHDGYILEKPDDVSHARKMLQSLSGSSHHVHTGVAIVLPQAAQPAGQSEPYCRTFSETTNVIFDKLHEELIDAYIQTGEPFGKAGSYGIQGAASSFVTGVSGCYFNVVGFPLHSFSQELLQLVKEGHLVL